MSKGTFWMGDRTPSWNSPMDVIKAPYPNKPSLQTLPTEFKLKDDGVLKQTQLN